MIDNDEEYDLDDEIINKIPDENDKKFIIDFIQKDGVKLIQNICDECNIKLLSSNEDVADGYIAYEDNEFKIYINKTNIATARQRFTVAHELGHFFLHRDAIKQYKSLDRGDLCDVENKQERSAKVQMEREANNFAAALLMPSKQFYELYRQTKNINIVAKYFWVSESAAKIRATKLGLLGIEF
jgi:Zn-dependent peptidase ImmA (M78 family)